MKELQKHKKDQLKRKVLIVGEANSGKRSFMDKVVFRFNPNVGCTVTQWIHYRNTYKAECSDLFRNKCRNRDEIGKDLG